MLKPLGGKLIEQYIVDKKEIEKISSEGLRRVPITEDVLLELECIATGSYSPLTGFPHPNEIDSILSQWSLSDGTPFPIPPLFHVQKKVFDDVAVGETVILQFNGEDVGVCDLDGKRELDKKGFMDTILKTRDPEHPGVAHISHIQPYLLTGDISFLGNKMRFFGEDSLTPRKARVLFREMGWETISIFSTTNVPHRAHEFMHRLALEQTDGLFIHALRQFKEEGYVKYPLDLIKKCHQDLIKTYYPPARVSFSILPIIAWSGGPREVGLQAVIRQNFGCTHHIVGRDHSGFKDVYGLYDSQKVFERLPGLDINVLPMKGPHFCSRCKMIVTKNTCRHSDENIEEVSGTRIRNYLSSGKDIPSHLMRKEVSQTLKNWMRSHEQKKLHA